jgi:hypothetical protein
VRQAETARRHDKHIVSPEGGGQEVPAWEVKLNHCLFTWYVVEVNASATAVRRTTTIWVSGQWSDDFIAMTAGNSARTIFDCRS